MPIEGSIRAIGRGIRVLQVVNHHRSISMMEIARQCRLPYPTTCRIVETLIEEHMIEREPTRKHYRPTSLVKTLSVGYQADDALARASRRHICGLTRELRWPISVCTRVGMSMMIRESTHGIAPFTLNLYHPGYTLPLLESSSGKVHLAFSDEDEQEQAIEHVRRLNQQSGDAVASRLRSVLLEIRANGYGVHDRIRHTANPGKTSAISVPILRDGSCEATVTLAFFASSMTVAQAVRTFAPRLRHVADAIACELSQLDRVPAAETAARGSALHPGA